MTNLIGLDIGGTKLIAARTDERGEIIARTQESTPPCLAEGLALLHDMIETVRDGAMPDAIGAAIGGPLDRARGTVSPLHQPQWRDVPLRAILSERWSCPIEFDVDTNVAALGEYERGGEKAARFLYMTVSTGIGGGFMVDGKPYVGAGGMHPEVGHQSIPFRCAHPTRVACECGAPDCLEALASGNGIRRVYGRRAEELGDDEWAEVAWNLGQGLRNLATILAPDVIVLGGGVALGGGEAFVQRATEVMREHLHLAPAPNVRLSCLGLDTAVYGAIVLARRATTH